MLFCHPTFRNLTYCILDILHIRLYHDTCAFILISGSELLNLLWVSALFEAGYLE